MKQKRLKKIIMMILIGATALGILPGAVSAVHAEDPEAAMAAITKELRMAEGVTAPGAEFTFRFTSLSVDGETATPENMPVITDKSVVYSSADTSTAVDGLVSVKKETGNIFAGVTFPHAGEYIYSVAEVADTYSVADSETISYSYAEYEMRVLVANLAGGGVYIKYVFVVPTVDAEGAPVAEGGKVDAAPSAPGGEGNGFKFVNTYTKRAGAVDPENPADDEAALTINNEVVGSYGDTTKQFTFNIAFVNAATSNAASYTGKITRQDSSVEEQVFGSQGFGILSTGTEFTLAKGETLTFDDLPVGTKYTLSVAGAENYTTAVTVTENGVEAAHPGQKGQLLSLPEIKIGENTNKLACIMTFDDGSIEETGILMNNLPFFVLIAVVVAAFAGVAASKKLRRELP